MTVEEGRSQLVTIETSLPEYQQASATVHVVTLQEYESLTNDSQIEYKMALTELLRAHFNLTQVSFQYLDTAEGYRHYVYTSGLSYLLILLHF